MALASFPKWLKFLYVRDLKKGKNETLGLPMDDSCIIDYVNTDPDDVMNPQKYSVIKVHYTPEAGIWAGGTYTLSLTFTDAWPNEPPKTKCETQIWHPNIDTHGDICHSLVYLKGGAHPNGEFTSMCTLEMLLQGVLTLFNGSENYDDPLNLEASSQYLNEGADAFEQKARQWVQQYAQAQPEVPPFRRPQI
eukprot:TRINITY_DN6670_c0_g1_i1.p1 TRINITY_DN6670_c0_g1~~TRINITY_DN6670_c0_g1_i1.p1  ORF type:complete len:192 (-),score=43.39 TRINITY_DN6670_c0_g1_i1:143-718(-)